jgi:hypothetical protein
MEDKGEIMVEARAVTTPLREETTSKGVRVVASSRSSDSSVYSRLTALVPPDTRATSREALVETRVASSNRDKVETTNSSRGKIPSKISREGQLRAA